MNKSFLPNEAEQKLLSLVQEFIRNDFALIRMTGTMLSKSIIDASSEIRMVLGDSGLVDYNTIELGSEGKLVLNALVLSAEGTTEKKVSFYRPKTKFGDPRFWVYGLKNFVKVGDLVYFTVREGQLFTIPFIYSKTKLQKLLEMVFGKVTENDLILGELLLELRRVVGLGWIQSIKPDRYPPAPKDAGETLEQQLGIAANNLISADFKGKIEIKTKLSRTTSNTLFCCSPNWEISNIPSAAKMVLTYGYQSRRYEGYRDLYITVTNKPNNQGLFLETDDEGSLLLQSHAIGGETCKWEYNELKERLYNKHPKTAWIIVEAKLENGITYFRYTEIEITQDPIFTQFLLLIEQGLITFDWRGRVKKDGSGYKDKGHAFRIKDGNKPLLFGSLRKVRIE